MNLTTRFQAVQEASRALAGIPDAVIGQLLCHIADELEEKLDYVLGENQKDLARMDPANPKYDRLKLTPERLKGIAADMRQVASLPTPVGEVLSQTTRPNGMTIRKVRVPFGVIGIIYEARPNVTLDVCSLCLKAGNACILKGGSDAHCSNVATVGIIHHQMEIFGINPDTVMLMPDDHAATQQLLEAVDYVDLIIPRGSKSLIDFVRSHARVPVIETGAGICHTYFDQDGDLQKGAAIIHNAKTRRVSVCNALDCLVVHASRLTDLPALCEHLATSYVTIYADEPAFKALQGHYPDTLLYPAQPEHFGTEFLDYKMAVKTVNSLDEALAHIQRYSSKHSEAIVSENAAHVRLFEQKVDAACVYANVSTAFTDGGQFGFGAEIGISTQKMHARGPMALPEITTYKYIVEGDGQTRHS